MSRAATLPPDLASKVSDVGFAALELPAAARESYACRRLLADAAMSRLRSRAAARTVLLIAAEVLAVDEAYAREGDTVQ